MQPGGWKLGDTSYSPLIARRNLHDDAEFDITAMIDLVFLMNLYFLVTFLTAIGSEISLPTASHVSPLDMDTAIVLTVTEGLSKENVSLFLGDGPKGEPITKAEDQDRAIREIVEQQAAEGKTAVLIKAEKNICLRELFRIMSAATYEGVKLHVAVMEVDRP